MIKNLLLLFCLISICLQNIEAKDILIKWNDTISISKKDFLSEDCGNSSAAIVTDISYYAHSSKGVLTLDVSSFMVCNESYYCVEENPLLTEHETIHFMIAEVCARTIRARISRIKSKDQKTIYSKVKSIYQEETKKKTEINDRYDLETDHGTRKREQSEWSAEIRSELKRLAKYSNTSVHFRIKK